MDFKSVRRIIKRALNEAHDEAVLLGVDTSTADFNERMEVLRVALLEKMGLTVAQYEKELTALKTAAKEKSARKLEAHLQELGDLETKIKAEVRGMIPPPATYAALPDKPTLLTKEEVSALVAEAIAQLPKKESRPLVKIERPVTQITERVEYDDRALRQALAVLDSRISQIVIPEAPQPLDLEKLKEDIRVDMTAHLQKNIDILGMPDFRKLAMGLRGDLDAIGPGPFIKLDGSNTPTTGRIDFGSSSTKGIKIGGLHIYDSTIPGDDAYYFDAEANHRIMLPRTEMTNALSIGENFLYIGIGDAGGRYEYDDNIPALIRSVVDPVAGDIIDISKRDHITRLGDSSGADEFRVQDSGSNDQFKVNSDGKAFVYDRANFAAAAGSTTAGDLWHDTTQKALQTYVDGIEQTFVGCIFTATATASTSSTNETTLIGSGVGTVTLPANFFVAGKTVRIKFYGYTDSTGGGTVQIKAKLGSTTVFDNTSNAYIAGAGNRPVSGEVVMTCRTTGGSGTVMTQGYWLKNTSDTAGAPMSTANTAAATIDTTASQTIDLTGTCAAATTVVHITNLTVKILN